MQNNPERRAQALKRIAERLADLTPDQREEAIKIAARLLAIRAAKKARKEG